MVKFLSFNIYGVFLLASTLVNIFFFTFFFLDGGKWRNQLSWSQSAAAEAESAASVYCSGHGRAYLDGFVTINGKPVCECNTCFQGPDCSEFVTDCVADADGGDPLFLEPFWMQNAASSALVVSGWHRMSYSFPDHSSISQQLIRHIRKTHEISKNAVTDGRYILFGAGSTLLLNAAVYALSPDNSSFPARIVTESPYYPLYESQTNYFKTANFQFLGDVSLVKNTSYGMNFIEFVTSPNNPDGYLREAVLQGPSVKSIYDHAYYWPYFTAIPAPADEDVMIFTISKLTGHAGSRFGWAIIKDKNVYDRMSTYISTSQMGISRDTQLRALKLLKVLIKDEGKEIFDFGYRKMRDRWDRLNKIVSMSKHFSLQKISPQYCTFFNRVREPSPEGRWFPAVSSHMSSIAFKFRAYAWLKCEREEDTNCSAVLRASKIIGRGGRFFNVEERFIRLSLIKSQDDFEMLLYRLNQLVTINEEGAKAIF